MGDEDNKRLLRSRTSTKGWVTKKAATLTNLLADPDIDFYALGVACDEFDAELAKLDNLQCEIEIAIEDERVLQKEIDEASIFRDQAKKPRIKAGRKFAERASEQPLPASSHSSESSTSRQRMEAKLPKLTLTHFSGRDILKFQPYWDLFKVTIDEKDDLPKVVKFTYLLETVEDEAARCLEGLSLTDANYDVAKELLTDRYGRKDKVIVHHIMALLELKTTSCSVSALQELNDKLLFHTRALENLEIKGSQYGVLLTPVILHSLPSEIKLEWARDADGHESDLDFLMTFLKSEVTRRTRSGLDTSSPSSSSTAHALVSGPVKSSSCPIVTCGKAGHSAVRCFKITKEKSTDKRLSLIQKSGLCIRCLTPNSSHDLCQAKCSHCQGRHHVLLCTDESKKPKPRSKKPDMTPPEKSPPAAATPVSTASSTLSGQNASSTSAVGSNGAAPAKAAMVTGTTDKYNVSPDQNNVLLMSARTHIYIDGVSSVEANVNFDSMADRSWVTLELAKRANLKLLGKSKDLSLAAFGVDTATDGGDHDIFLLPLQDKAGTIHSIPALGIENICPPLMRPGIPEFLVQRYGVPACDYTKTATVNVDVLVGADFFWRFMGSPSHKVAPEFRATPTVFGIIFSGQVPSCFDGSGKATVLVCAGSRRKLPVGVSDATVETFWDLESIGVSPPGDETVDPAMELFKGSVTKVGGRYEVGLPWKPSMKDVLMSNKHQAVQRLNHLQRKLDSTPGLRDRYDKVFVGMLDMGIIEEIDPEEPSENPVFYLPNRPHLKEESLSTKVRPVFDASANGFNGVSLNDCMYAGPNLMNDMASILLRFRRWRIALVADIEKAFHMISVSPADRDALRFLWCHDGRTKTMRFCRLPFGNSASPFLLLATLQHHMSSFDSRAASDLRDNMFVDNFLTGTDEVEEALELIHDSTSILQQAEMNLRQWVSNDTQVGSALAVEFSGIDLGTVQEERIPVLGIQWIPGSDVFAFKGPRIPPTLRITKRTVLSTFSKFFDPSGWAAPFVVTVKTLFQELWELDLPWDMPVPPDIEARFRRWLSDIEIIKNWSIPRCYTPIGWSGVEKFELHAFGDASPKSYGACVYLVAFLPGGSKSSNLVMAKARQAPLKGKLTIPRLELMAALLCARLVKYVKSSLKLECEFTCYSDSKISLAWIQGDVSRWKQWVANRVKDILKDTKPENWRYCPTDQNPADLLTRGISADELIHSHLWLHGPSFLLSSQIPEEVVFYTEEECIKAKTKVSANLTVSTESSADVKHDSTKSSADVKHASVESSADNVTPLFDVQRWSSLNKAVRVVAKVQRFVHNFIATYHLKSKSDCRISAYTAEELAHAKLMLIKDVQRVDMAKLKKLSKLSPFLARDGLLRVQGRIEKSALSYEEKHPILLLGSSPLSILLTRFTHFLLKHAGVPLMLTQLRNEYWIVGGRRVAKDVKRFCTACQRQDARPGGEVLPDLPFDRVNKAVPFEVMGMDHGGPLYCLDTGNRKHYILVMTCAVTRAIQLELVDSMTGMTTCRCLRRLAARRGLPRTVYSDNHKGFERCQVLIVEEFGAIAPKWKFIAPLSPWRGGWWERLVGTVKSALKKTLGRLLVCREELETILFEVEACINSRPLTFVSDEIDGTEPLTPAHFLLGHGRGFYSSVPTGDDAECKVDLAASFECRKCTVNQFWKIWSQDYIRSLPCSKGSAKPGLLKPGSLVLLQENSPRMKWPLGVVDQVFTSSDGLVRTVDVRTKNGNFLRSIPKLHALELAPAHVVSTDFSPPHVVPNFLQNASVPVPDNDTHEAAGASATDVAMPTIPTDSHTDATRSVTDDKSKDIGPIVVMNDNPMDTEPAVVTRSGRKIVKPSKLNLCSVVSKPK